MNLWKWRAHLSPIFVFPAHAKAELGYDCRSCRQGTRRNREKAVEASRYAMLCRQLYPEDRSVLSQVVQLALLAGTNCERDVLDQFNQLSAQGVDGFQQYNISEAMNVIRKSQKRASDLLEEYSISCRNRKENLHLNHVG